MTPNHCRHSALFILHLTVCGTATAYVGPGAGLSLLGALWGLLAAIGAALLFLLLWPLRRMHRRRQQKAGAGNPDDAETTATTPKGTPQSPNEAKATRPDEPG